MTHFVIVVIVIIIIILFIFYLFIFYLFIFFFFFVQLVLFLEFMLCDLSKKVFLKCGRGISGCSSPPIIFNPKMKTAAERLEFPLSARLIYDLFIVDLLEEEELLDDFIVEGLNPGIMQITGTFKIPSNARLAKLATATRNLVGEVLCGFET